MNYYIGIDLGTSSCKGSVVDKYGKVYGSHSVKYGVHCPAPNYSEQDPADWLPQTNPTLLMMIAIMQYQRAIIAIEFCSNRIYNNSERKRFIHFFSLF